MSPVDSLWSFTNYLGVVLSGDLCWSLLGAQCRVEFHHPNSSFVNLGPHKLDFPANSGRNRRVGAPVCDSSSAGAGLCHFESSYLFLVLMMNPHKNCGKMKIHIEGFCIKNVNAEKRNSAAEKRNSTVKMRNFR